MNRILYTICCLSSLISHAQGIKDRLSMAIENLQGDAQFKHAIMSMYVVESKTGKVVFSKNEETGLAPASCQKVITSATAFELLGNEFRYVTYIGKDPTAQKDYDAGALFLIGRGDPTLGSRRWESTADTNVFSKILQILKDRRITRFSDGMYIDDLFYGLQPLPEGWIWQDIGNYYGAGCFGFNWKENQFDLVLQPGKKEGYPTMVKEIKPLLPGTMISNFIMTGKEGSGDNGYIYSSPFSNTIITKGTIPLQARPFSISGSMPNPADVFKAQLLTYLEKNGIIIKGKSYSAAACILLKNSFRKATQYLDSIPSPPLDSINYWFLKKSVNLFGEALLKSIAIKYNPYGTTDIYEAAITRVKDFWASKGIEPSAINIIDGSGLSPANRVTTHALVSVLQYARLQKWFPSFYYALPEINGIKMKDGYINGVRSYTGFIKTNDGQEYTFSFIVNNFDGSAAASREKIWKIIDILK